MSTQTLPTLEQKATLVVGMGLTGRSVAAWLQARGQRFDMADTRNSLKDAEALRAAYPNSALFLGEGAEIDLADYQSLVLSPGLSPSIALVQRAYAQQLPVCGDIDLFAAEAKAPIIAVTGANGKSTVVDWLHHVLLSVGKTSKLGGNFGTPVLEMLDPSVDVYVLELSSFQLDTAELLRADIATLLNVSEDHMDRYDSLQHYSESKQRIYRDVRVAVVNRDDAVSQQGLASAAEQISFGLDAPKADEFGVVESESAYWLARGTQRLVNVSALKLLGRHNWSNALAVLALGEALGVTIADMLAPLCRYEGLPHRTEWIADIDGVTWVNDSKATNVGAVVAALNGIDRNVILLAGGDGKGADFLPLQEAALSQVSQAIVFGQDRAALAETLSPVTSVALVETLDEAVAIAANDAVTGDVVLLSPACASLDQFPNYIVRGECFRSLVEAMLEGAQ